MTLLRLHVVWSAWIGFVVAADGCAKEPCYVPAVPEGPEAASYCDCPDGTLFFCASEETCAGTVGATTCEAQQFMAYLNQQQFCGGCRAGFTDAGAIFVECTGSE